MKRWILIILLCQFYLIHYGQFSDNFQDGDLLANPSWSGDTQDYLVNNNFQLQLSASEAGSSELFIQSFYPDSVEWNIYFKMDFAPSTSNQLKIYLMSSDTDLNNTQAYYLEVGESGSADALKFYRQDGDVSVLLGAGTMGAVGAVPAEARLVVLRHGDGFWEIKADYNGGTAPVSELEIFDNTYSTNQEAYFILSCIYSDSRKDKFFFDDILMSEIIPDTEPPIISDIQVVAENFVRLIFNEALDEISAENISNYQTNPILNIVSASYLGNAPYSVNLLFNENLQSGIIYHLDVYNIEDLKGNQMVSQSLNFKLLEDPEVGDIIVNEILFDPFQDAEDFVEIYNRSDKFLRLNRVLLANLDKSELEPFQSGIEMDPRSYLAFSPDIQALENHYVILDPTALVQHGLPSFNNETGNVSLILLDSGNFILLDSVNYEETQHYILLDETEGVSLERIDPNGSSADPANWHSAASSVGFATPGYKNSQFHEGIGTMKEAFNVQKKVFSPNGDGRDDLLFVEFELSDPGFVANMKIFNSHGRFVKNLGRNMLLPTSGFVKWDGTTEENRLAPIGIYIVWVELFHPDGRTEQFTMDCVLAQQLN